jgi:glutathione peroxidase
MNRLTFLMTLAAGIATVSAADAPTLQGIPLKTIEGKDATLGDYKGKVLLVVNVASQCGYTRQYAGLQSLHEKLKDKGFTVLGFPCNDFGGQEPGSEAEIQSFCSSRYQVTFPMFSKVKILGSEKHSLFAALTAGGADVGWNFEKFLLGKDGKLIARYASDAEPEGAEIEDAVKKELGQP